MKHRRLWMMVVLMLSLFTIIVAQREARAGKSLGITKKAYIKAYNQQLSRLLGMRFEKSKDSDSYTLSDNSAILFLQPNGSENIEEIVISVMNTENRKERDNPRI